MRKILLAGFFGLAALVAGAQVSIISVTDEDKHTVKSDFLHTFEYTILPLGGNSSSGNKCQATRIGRRWFATAAHCVKRACAKSCQIRLDLLEQPVSAWATVTHTAKKPAVFVHPDFNYDVFVKNDLALIRLDLDRTPQTYYKRGDENIPHTAITRQQFEQFLEQTPAARSALYHIKSPSFPPILAFDAGNYILDRKISVISIFNGRRSVFPNPNPVHYVKALELAYTRNFGIRRGMSGSGVMSNTGEFLGVISGVFSVSGPSSTKPNSPAKTEEWFMFFAFNSSALEFMKEVMGSDFYKLDIKDAYPNYVHKSRQNYSEIISRMKDFSKPKTPTKSAPKPTAK